MLNASVPLTGAEMLSPSALSATVAAGSSYVTAPSTLRRTHGSGRPSVFESVMRPSRMETDGRIAKTALDATVRLMTLPSMPSWRLRRTAFTRK